MQAPLQCGLEPGLQPRLVTCCSQYSMAEACCGGSPSETAREGSSMRGHTRDGGIAWPGGGPSPLSSSATLQLCVTTGARGKWPMHSMESWSIIDYGYFKPVRSGLICYAAITDILGKQLNIVSFDFLIDGIILMDVEYPTSKGFWTLEF